MSEQTSFEDLIRRVRAGDQDAAADLVKRYEPAIRRAVRFRLTDTRLMRVLDSMDICQSVFASFFVRTANGQFDIEARLLARYLHDSELASVALNDAAAYAQTKGSRTSRIPIG